MEINVLEELLEQLENTDYVPADVWQRLLSVTDAVSLAFISSRARDVARASFGTGVYVRALIEISSYCRRGCYYCGLRCANRTASRYRLTRQQILECCRTAAERGFNTFVLQGGEDAAMTDEWLAAVVGEIKALYPEKAVTLSVGERSFEGYTLLRKAGADRYLLRHETADDEHYARLHPASMNGEKRRMRLEWLKSLGFQVGAGMMIGSPGQQLHHLVEDLLFLDRLKPQMIGVGPFIPATGTPFENEPAGSAEHTLLVISLLRLRFPHALLPATTALASLAQHGTLKGILAGANVVMPNVTPSEVKGKYTIYNNKKSTGTESLQGLRALEEELQSIGYHIDYGRGDYKTDNHV